MDKSTLSEGEADALGMQVPGGFPRHFPRNEAGWDAGARRGQLAGEVQAWEFAPHLGFQNAVWRSVLAKP